MRAATTFLGVVLFAIVCALSIRAIEPPNVVPRTAPATEFSAERALDDLQVIAHEPHPTSSDAAKAVAGHLATTFTAIGLEVRFVSGHSAVRVAGNVFSAAVTNVVARLPGTAASGKAIALVAHYDSVRQSFGASDDGSGTAMLLEAARVLRARPRLERDVLFIATDAEEMAALGAKVVADQLEPEIGVVLNFEARGSRGAVAMYDPAPESGELVRILAEVAPMPITSSFVSALAKALPNDSDVTVFKRKGIPALGFAYADGFEDYHRHTDDTAHIDPRSLQHDGSYAVAMADALGHRDLSSIKAPDIAYFDVFGKAVLHYPFWLAQLLAVFTIAFFGWLLREAKRLEVVTVKGALGGAGVFLGGVVLAALAAGLAQMLFGRFLDFTTSIVRGKSIAGCTLLLGAAVLLLVWGSLLRRIGTWNLALGALGVWSLLLVVAAVLAPGVSPPLEWPLLGALVGSGWFLRRGARAALFFGALPTAVVFSAVVYSIIVAVGATMAFAPVLFAALAAGLFVPVLGEIDVRARSILVGVTLALGIGVGYRAARMPYPRDARWVDSLVYGVDQNDGSERYFTFDWGVDGWVVKTLGKEPQRAPMPAFSRYARALPFVSRPPVADRTVNAIEVLADDARDPRHVRLRVTTDPATRCVRLWDESGAVLRATAALGAPLVDLFRFSPEQDEKILRAMVGDDSPRTFHMEHCGDASFELELDARPGEKMRLRLVGETMGLPEGVPARPSWSIPYEQSDVTLVSKSFSL